MPKYSEQDLHYAAELREEIHKEALAIVRKTRPDVTDRHPVEDYFQDHWDYPGKRYTGVAALISSRSHISFERSFSCQGTKKAVTQKHQ